MSCEEDLPSAACSVFGSSSLPVTGSVLRTCDGCTEPLEPPTDARIEFALADSEFPLDAEPVADEEALRGGEKYVLLSWSCVLSYSSHPLELAAARKC